MERADDFRHRLGVDRGRGRHRHLLRSRIGQSAKERIVTAAQIIDRHPDIIIGSWCGKRFRPEKVVARLGFEQIPAVQNNELHEIKSLITLQPGPAALVTG
jgi:iron complex transport system substrate-binding protein